VVPFLAAVCVCVQQKLTSVHLCCENIKKLPYWKVLFTFHIFRRKEVYLAEIMFIISV